VSGSDEQPEEQFDLLFEALEGVHALLQALVTGRSQAG
jgi:hypothetical protein